MGDFIAYINYRSLELSSKGTAPKLGEVGYDAYKKQLDDITRDASLVMQDPLLMASLGSGDPKLMSETQAAYVSASLGLDAKQKREVQAIIQTAYTFGYSKNLDGRHQPAGDTSTWEADRIKLNEAAATMMKKVLTSVQLKQFDQFGYSELIFNLTVGAPKP